MYHLQLAMLPHNLAEFKIAFCVPGFLILSKIQDMFENISLKYEVSSKFILNVIHCAQFSSLLNKEQFWGSKFIMNLFTE